MTVVHAFDLMTVPDQVAPDHIGQRQVVIHDHDPAGRIRVAQHAGHQARAAAGPSRELSQVTVATVAGNPRAAARPVIRHSFVRVLAGSDSYALALAAAGL